MCDAQTRVKMAPSEAMRRGVRRWLAASAEGEAAAVGPALQPTLQPFTSVILINYLILLIDSAITTLRGHQRILMVQWPNRVSSN